MEIGNININLPKIFSSDKTKNKSLVNLKEPIKDSYVHHNDTETDRAVSELGKIKKSDGSGFDIVEKYEFKELYKKGAIDIDVVKTFKDTKLNLYAMSDIYKMKKDRNDSKFYDKVFEAMDKIPNGRNATDFTQSWYEPTKEFSLNFSPEKMTRTETLINSKVQALGKSYKFDANSLEVLSETNAKTNLGLSKSGIEPELTVNTIDYKHNSTIQKKQKIDDKGFLELKKQVVTTKDKNDNVVKIETMLPSKDVKGMYDVEVEYADGKKEQIAKSTFDKKTGITTIKKDMKSADGTHTEYLYEDDKQGNRIVDYKITDKDGKILMRNSQSFEVIDDNHFVSSKNGYKYDITLDDKKISVKNMHTNEESSLEFKKRAKGNKDELTKLLKKVPGDELIEVIDSVKNLKINDKSKTLDSYYDVLSKSINTGDDLMVFLHELGHAKDMAFVKKRDVILSEKDSSIYTSNKDIQKVYLEERKAFNENHTDTEREHVVYFTQAKGHYGGKWGGLKELIAETNALTNTYTDEAVEALGPRTQYLQQHFPKTIAAIRDAMNWKDDIAAINYYGT